MPLLTEEQKDQFWRHGVLVVENAVGPKHLASLRDTIARSASWYLVLCKIGDGC